MGKHRTKKKRRKIARCTDGNHNLSDRDVPYTVYLEETQTVAVGDTEADSNRMPRSALNGVKTSGEIREEILKLNF